MKNTVLVIDAGGRGSALVDAYAKSHHVSRILAIPGNDLMLKSTQKKVKIFPHLTTTSIQEIVKICKVEKVNLVDVAHDNAIEAGLVDTLIHEAIPAVGPTKLAGQIEWDKAWARRFMEKYNIPHPKFKVCTSQKEGTDFIKKQNEGIWFVKASGLAEGKGVLPAKDNSDALVQIRQIKKFGNAGKTFLIEQALVGEEFSLFAITDGKDYQIIGVAQDYKRLYNNDTGPNTGGMGCTSPPLILTQQMLHAIKKTILDKTITGLLNDGRLYKGILYLGGMVVQENGKQKVYVIEFNSRWGDPEAQVILPGLKSDLYELSQAVLENKIRHAKISRDRKTRIVVSAASRGYPQNYSSVKGKQIFGIENVRKLENIKIYGAGVKMENGKAKASGGRLFHIVGEGKNIIEARKKAYEAMSYMYVEGNNLHYRTDIGWRDIERLVSHDK